MRTLIVIPTYNERENIGSVVTEIMLLGIPGLSVLIVDDASPDGTGRLADELARSYPDRVSVLHRRGKLGIGSAYMDGFRFGRERGFDVLGEMDADGSHEPNALRPLLAEIERGADVAVGSRHVRGGRIEGWGPHRHLMSRGAITLSRIALGLRTRDVTSGFRCYRAGAVDLLLRSPMRSHGYAFQEESIAHCEKQGFVVREIPITFRDRIKGKSKLSRSEVIEFFRTIRALRKRYGRRGSPGPSGDPEERKGG